MAKSKGKGNIRFTYTQGHSGTGERAINLGAAEPSILGSPFHNPYTFVPFPKEGLERHPITPRSVDELENDRQSGILELEVQNISPLLTSEAEPLDKDSGHKEYKALTIGEDVIVPATGVRGMLRNLMTILTGSALGYLDESIYLCQGRDVQLGPQRGKREIPHLAEVLDPGDENHAGTIQLGETRLVKVTDLQKMQGFKDKESFEDKEKNLRQDHNGKRNYVYVAIDSTGRPTSFHDREDKKHNWKLKLSGPYIIKKGASKKEGIFQAGSKEIKLPAHFWAAYQGRNRHGSHPELKRGDLVWLETNPIGKPVHSEKDILSLQWARWGKKGRQLKEALPYYVRPNALQKDQQVDIVTDLFGMVPMEENRKSGTAFAGRIRPHNLIFQNGKKQLTKMTPLAVLGSPHPGCLAFYRDDDLDSYSQTSPLKGYKVYRNTTERGKKAPWHYHTQGVYDDKGQLQSKAQQKVNKSAELLNEGQTGKLRIAFHGLKQEELALLLTACSVDWKLGGGKPLGLGHCRVTRIILKDETGKIQESWKRKPGSDQIQLPEKIAAAVSQYRERIELYKHSQLPVNFLRYPRSVEQNNNKIVRAGLQWFARHALPKRNSNGLAPLWLTGKFKNQVGKDQIQAQALPPLPEQTGMENLGADYLYGYDVYADTQKIDGKSKITNPCPFDPKQFQDIETHPAPNTSPNRLSRQARRDAREVPSDSGSAAKPKKEVPNQGVAILGHPAGGKDQSKKGNWKAHFPGSREVLTILNTEEIPEHLQSKGTKIKVKRAPTGVGVYTYVGEP